MAETSENAISRVPVLEKARIARDGQAFMRSLRITMPFLEKFLK